MTDEQKSAVRHEVKHHMGRRCFNWNYSSRCIYMITITLADRSRPILGQLVGEGEEWRVAPSEIGRIVEQCWREIPQQWLGVEIIESQLMPDHFHGLIFVKEPQKKKLGNIIGSFKSKSSSRAGDFAARGEAQNIVDDRIGSYGEARNLAVGGLGSRGEARNMVGDRIGSCGEARNGQAMAGGKVPQPYASARAPGIWAPGYVDLILFRAGQLEQMIAYIRDNPRRLGIKRAYPELFKVARDIEVYFAARGEAQNPARDEAHNLAADRLGSYDETHNLAAGRLGSCGEAQNPAAGCFGSCGEARNMVGDRIGSCSEARSHSLGVAGSASARERAGIPPWHGPAKGHFMAIGNHFLLARPIICQIQCSRSFFAYKRRRLASGWQICRDSVGKPIVERSTPEFEAKAEAAMCAAAKGAVLLSPCISHGEREIARRAFEAGYRVITLQNKGFSPLYKPGGKLFETCAAGNLLMLSPIGWPYIPGEKPMTREHAQILNRIAQLISGDGAVEINYKGMALEGIDDAVSHAVET